MNRGRASVTTLSYITFASRSWGLNRVHSEWSSNGAGRLASRSFGGHVQSQGIRSNGNIKSSAWGPFSSYFSWILRWGF